MSRVRNLSLSQLSELASRRKQSLEQEEFLALWSAAPDLVSAARLQELTDYTLAELERACRGRAVAFGWSGGKDSLVLQDLCCQIGVTSCVLVITDLEIPAFLRWVENARPEGLTVVQRPFDFTWLARHPHMLFPRDHTVARRWFSLVQHTGQRTYYRDQNLDVLILGRRRIDGNYVPVGDGFHRAGGICRFLPLRDWDHAEIFAYLQTRAIALPPNYGWPRGFRVGTSPWPVRRCRTVEQGWEETFEIDPGIVTAAACHLASARAFLRKRSRRRHFPETHREGNTR